MKVHISLTAIILLFTSCIGIKYLQPGEAILYDQEIISTGNLDKDALEGLLTQQPNKKLVDTKIFGVLDVTLPIAHRVYIYNWGKENFDSARLIRKREAVEKKIDRKIAKAKTPAKRSRLREKKLDKLEDIDTRLTEGNLRMRFGEELAVFDSNAVETSSQKLKSYLFSKGYFDADVKAEVDTLDYRLLETTYTIVEKKPYVIDSLFYAIKDPDIKKLFFENIGSQKLVGSVYDENLISQERSRVYDLMVDNGYYDFKRQYILFEVDSTILDDRKLVVRETIVNPPGQEEHKPFKLDSIIFTTESGVRSSLVKQLEPYNDVTYNFALDEYPKRLLDWRIFIEKDSLYSKNLTLQTQRQLSYLDMYKFVNINYDTTGGKFIANIFTSPLKRFQTSSEIGLSVIGSSYPGPFFNFNAKSRNFFKGLEIIQFDANASIAGISSVADQETAYTRLQYGGQLSVTFPQFLFPLKNSLRKRIGRYNPRTKFATGVNFEFRREEYERTTLYTNVSYIWQVKNNTQFTLKPTDLSIIYSDPTDFFEKNVLATLPRSLSSAFESSFVTFTSLAVEHSNNNYGLANTDAYLIRGQLETGGNISPLIEDRRFLAGLETYEYVKASFDYRRNNRINESTSYAYRFNTGVALSYGSDSSSLPYEKYFFAGGSNSIRAWQPRRLGPGSFTSRDLESPGDILLEASIEFRKDLVGFVEYAFFLDAGNTWLWKSSTVGQSTPGSPEAEDISESGKFNFRNFSREIAVGAGFGLRFDFSFLLLRADVAYKIVDPAYPLGERFVLDEYTQIGDLFNKATLNIGIGYPF